MTRHSKQKGGIGSEALTYSERQALGYGTCTERLGKDSTKDFDCCALCLQPVQDAVVTPDGVLYEREVILESLLAQKKEAARRLALWEAQQGEEARASETAAQEAAQREIAAFHTLNSGGGGGPQKSSAEARRERCASCPTASHSCSTAAAGRLLGALKNALHRCKGGEAERRHPLPRHGQEAEAEGPGDCEVHSHS